MSNSIIKQIFRLGWPMFVAQMAVMLNGLIDTIMAGRYSTVDLAAVGIGSSIYFSVFVAVMGVLLALGPTVSQLYGAGRHGEVGEEVRQSIWLALVLAAVCLAALAQDEAAHFQLVDERDGGVVLHAQALGDGADGRAQALGQAADGEQQLVLLRLDAGVARGLLAEGDELSDLVPEGGQGAVVGDGDSGHRAYLAAPRSPF